MTMIRSIAFISSVLFYYSCQETNETLKLSYWNNDSLKAVRVDSGKAQVYVEYRKTGEVAVFHSMNDSSFSGPFCSFYENGKPLKVGKYKNGKNHGEYYMFRENGNYRGYKCYNEGKQYYSVEYSEIGEIIDTPSGGEMIKITPSTDNWSKDYVDSASFFFAKPPLTKCFLRIILNDINGKVLKDDTLYSNTYEYRALVDLRDERIHKMILEYHMYGIPGFDRYGRTYYLNPFK